MSTKVSVRMFYIVCYGCIAELVTQRAACADAERKLAALRDQAKSASDSLATTEKKVRVNMKQLRCVENRQAREKENCAQYRLNLEDSRNDDVNFVKPKTREEYSGAIRQLELSFRNLQVVLGVGGLFARFPCCSNVFTRALSCLRFYQ